MYSLSLLLAKDRFPLVASVPDLDTAIMQIAQWLQPITSSPTDSVPFTLRVEAIRKRRRTALIFLMKGAYSSAHRQFIILYRDGDDTSNAMLWDMAISGLLTSIERRTAPRWVAIFNPLWRAEA